MNQAEAKPFDLPALFAPIAVADFFRTHWERQPLHVHRGDAHYYDSIISNADLERIISSADLRYPAIQLARNGTYLPAEAYTKAIKHGSEFFNGVPDLQQVQSEYRSGATVVLPALQRTWAPLRELCAMLEKDFSHPAHANAYLTPGDSPGFTPHYDTHEVFVLQIAGTKRWRVYPPPHHLPHRSQPFVPIGFVLPAPLIELELKPGDLLYLPRGYVHAANTSQGHSAHITVGMTVYTWVELIAELIGSARETAQFRTALPPGFATRDDLKKTLRDGLVRCIEQLRNNVDDRVIESFLQKVQAGRIAPEAATFQSDVRVIGLQTKLKVPDPGSYRVITENRNAVLEFAGRKFLLPEKLRVTVDDMCRRKSFKPAELSSPLDNEGRLTLTRYLHGEHFLTLID
jgi:ribosomal protein L16 Arg81 hydroxylase